jgi:hypothetical protein
MYVSSSPVIFELIGFPAIDDDQGNHQEQVGELIKQMVASIDNLALKMLFVTIQQNNLEICIECAMNRFVDHMSAVALTYLNSLLQGYLQKCLISGIFSLEL